MKTAASAYAARVDAVVAQRTRLRGTQPPGDMFAHLPPEHPLLHSEPCRPLDSNLAALAAYVEPNDVVVDVGGGGGRVTLPLALRCRGAVNVDSSAAMRAGFEANAKRAGLTNVRFIDGDWLTVTPPVGDLALANHVTYLIREIVPFIEKLEAAGRRRVIITVGSPPPPAWHARLFQVVHGEDEEVVPGLPELLAVLWELGILPDVRVLPDRLMPYPALPTREQAVQTAVSRFSGDQLALWPLGPELEARTRQAVEAHFADWFAEDSEGFHQRWLNLGPEVLVTWEPCRT